MSKLTSIKAMLQNVLAQFAKLTTDKGILSFDGDELEVGASVTLVDEDGNESKPEDGEYKTAEGVIYVVADGKVTEIIEPEDTTGDDVAEPEPEAFSLLHRMAVKFESFLEKEDKIRAALAAKGIEGWLVDAGDDFVVVGVWQEEAMQDKFWKYSVSWDENGDAVIGDGEEVKNAFVPVEEDIEKNPVEDPAAENFEDQEPSETEQRIADLEAEIARLEEENGALKAENEELKKKLEEPASSPASEEFERAASTPNTGNKRLNKLVSILNA